MTSGRQNAGQHRVVLALLAVVSSLALLGPTSAWAQSPAPAPAAAQPANQNATAATIGINSVITVNADRTAETVETRRIRILGPGAVQAEGQQSLQYIEGMQTLDIEAYTEKPDGTKVPVDPASILTRDAATGLAAVYMRDAKVKTVLFRDVAVGDTLVLISRRVETGGVFFGHFNGLNVYPLNLPVTNSTTVIIAPKELALHVGVYGERMAHKVTTDETTTRHVIAYHPGRRTMVEANATSLFDRDPRIVITTFDNYEQLGESYWSAIEAKAQPTPDVAKLAEQITNGIEDRRAQAEAIDRWVKQNIRYVGVYLGTGRVIANDPATIVKNKFGDCKDHAILMAALLAAKGIASEQVLINLGDVYTLPETVAPGYFNHAMIFLPEFGVYDDPTAGLAAFGVLPRQSYDKPVLHASAEGAHLARTPVMQAAEQVATNRTRINVAADGVVTGETSDIATGATAIELRGVATQLQNVGLKSAAERVLQNLRNPGKGLYEVGTVIDGAQEYTLRGKFTLNNKLNVTPGAFVAIPRGMDLLSRPGEGLFGNRLPTRTVPFVCSAGRQIEDIEVTFADGLALPSAPKGTKIEKPQFTYASEYRIENRTLKIRREFESRVSGQVCAPETEAAIADLLKAVAADLNTGMSIPKAAVAKVEPPKPAPPKPATDTALVNRNQCAGFNNASADLRIGACTALIQSGQEPQAAIAVAFTNRGFAYRMKGDNARAVEDFDQALKLVPNYAVALNGRGLARHSLRDYDQAIADFSQAINLNPTFGVAYTNRGNALWDKGDRNGAMADFNQATGLEPMNAYVFQVRGRAYRVKSEFDRALADFDQVIRLQKNNAMAWNDRCYTHVLAGSAATTALNDCNEALRLDPKLNAALENRGLLMLRSNEVERAIADYDAVLRAAPKNAGALYGRGIAKLRKGDKEGGEADIAAANTLNAEIAKAFAKLGVTVATQDTTAEKPVL